MPELIDKLQYQKQKEGGHDDIGTTSRKSERNSSSRHSLFSIYYDSTTFLQKFIQHIHKSYITSSSSSSPSLSSTRTKVEDDLKSLYPIVSNERCGTWYAYPYANAAPHTHFKSTDGHININNFSLKRLNLHFLSQACDANKKGGAIMIADATKNKYKIQPDSFSKTIPIYCCVLNRLVKELRRRKRVRGRQEEQTLLCDNNDHDDHQWDDKLYVPNFISQTEHDSIIKDIPSRVQSALNSGVILDEEWLCKTLIKPLRCIWINHDENFSTKKDIDNDTAKINTRNWDKIYDTIQKLKSDYTIVLCVSVSQHGNLTTSTRTCWINNVEHHFSYIPGSADDEEFASWSKGLTPELFWKHHKEILFHEDKPMTNEETDEAIKRIMKQVKESEHNELDSDQSIYNFFDTLGGCNISIGSRKSGKPPTCWDHFDAILNVTDMEYNSMSLEGDIPEGKHYLQMQVKEGKKDRTELEKWMAVAMMFIALHAVVSNRRVLVHCAQGKDRSVAVVLAAVCIFCRISSLPTESSDTCLDTKKNFIYHTWCSDIHLDSFLKFLKDKGVVIDENEIEYYYSSGLPLPAVNCLLGRSGRDLLFQYLTHLKRVNTRSKCDDDDYDNGETFATKESIRIGLIAIQQFRTVACPSRCTMQKLNRFFMSNINYQ